MKKIEGSAVIENLNWRYATKRFDASKKISAADWATLEQALVLAPSSFGLQPWKFFVVDKPEIRAKLQAESWGQSQIVDASQLVVLAYKKDLGSSDVERYVDHIAKVRGIGKEALAEYKQMMLGFVGNAGKGLDVNAWCARQVYIALGTLLTTAAMLQIDACPMEGFAPDKYNEMLGLTKLGYSAVVLCTLGYRHAEDGYAKLAKVRYDLSDVVTHI